MRFITFFDIVIITFKISLQLVFVAEHLEFTHSSSFNDITMSQDSKKPSNMPMRKRLKPTVNLNVASRRRKDSKEASPLTDVSGGNLPKQNNSIKISTNNDLPSCRPVNESNVTRDSQVTELNKSFESTKSFSSAKTILLENYAGSAGPEVSKGQHGTPNSRITVTSSVSTVVWQNNSEAGSNNILDHSVDSVDELVELRTSNIEADYSSFSVDKTIEKAQNESLSSKNNSEKSVVSDKSLQNFGSEHFVADYKENTDALSFSENESKKSGSSRVPADLASERNADVESLNDDNVSSISENSYAGVGISPPKYKRKVSSMAKRLAEARRNFESRFCNKTPERSALRMFDLIYYNPSTNPMKSSTDKPQEVVCSPVSAVEDDVDDPAEEETSEANEAGNGIPAPRVKVGPNGEMILDEQSLVIETTQSKKSRKEIANLTVVVDTGSNTTYHTYSKKKRTRSDWTIKETVRFYEALQTLGTDFSLMQTLFPSRSRLDLKAKYKKEERINGHLIEKALRFPSLFDLSELEKESINEKQRRKENNSKVSQRKPRKRTLKAFGFDEEDTGPMLKKKRGRNEAKTSRSHDTDTGKENVETLEDCTSDEEYRPPFGEEVQNERVKGVTERRSSRVLNGKTPNYAALENEHDFLESGVDLLECSEDERVNEELETENENVSGENVPQVVTDFDVNDVPPGSLVIVTTQDPDNPVHRICKVYMVQQRSETNCDEAAATSAANLFTNTLDASVVDTGSVPEPS